jgi:hypothetical protein
MKGILKSLAWLAAGIAAGYALSPMLQGAGFSQLGAFCGLILALVAWNFGAEYSPD